MDQSTMKIIAHRGASHVAPENTMAAFNLAWEEGADGIELDIRQTGSDELIVIHDESTKRTTGTSLQVDMSHAKDLQKLDAGSWKNSQWTGEKIPLLNEVMEQLPLNKQILIEIKSGLATLSSLLKFIDHYPQQHHQMILISFHYDLIVELKRIKPALTILWIIEFGYNIPKFTQTSLQEVVQKTIEAKLDGLSSKAVLKHAEALIPYIQQYQWLWNVWTVDCPTRAKQFEEMGVHLLSTNTPKYLRKSLMGDAQ